MIFQLCALEEIILKINWTKKSNYKKAKQNLNITIRFKNIKY